MGLLRIGAHDVHQPPDARQVPAGFDGVHHAIGAGDVAQTGGLRHGQARRSLIDCRMSAITSPFGFAPMFPLPCNRTLTFPASMSRPPITSIVWTFACSALAILALIGSVPKSLSARTMLPRSSC